MAAAVVMGVGALTVVNAQAASSPTYGAYVPTNTTIERAPYATDLTQTSAELNWAITGKSPSPGYVEYGPSPSCTTFTAKPTANGLPSFVPNPDPKNDTSYQLSVSSQSIYQDSVQVSGLSPATPYCYEVFSSAGALLGPAQSFTTLDGATLPSTGLTFDVVGDLGNNPGVDEVGNVNADQAAIDTEIGQSGAKFAVTAGDVAYNDGSDTNYGSLTLAPTSPTSDNSDVFGPTYWPETGGIPTFQASGNHGQNITALRTWPEETTATASSGAYQYVSYPAISSGGLTAPSTNSPDDWYAVQDGNVRIYVIDAAWADGTGNGSFLSKTNATGAACPVHQSECEGYQVEAAEHWSQSSREYQWLKTDLQSQPAGTIKMAVFHYPLESLNTDQQTDPYLDTTLEPLLAQYGVSMAFAGHAHTYQRFVPKAGSTNQVISYVSGGGGGTLQSVNGSCATALAQFASVYAIGWSPTNSKGSICSNTPNETAAPTAAAQVYNYLQVNVTGNVITVTPVNATGGTADTFDQQTYTVVNGVTTLSTGSVTPPTTTTTTSTTSTSTTTTTAPSQPAPVALIQSHPASGATNALASVAAGDKLVLSVSQYTGATNHIPAGGVTDTAGDNWYPLGASFTASHQSEGELWWTDAKGGPTTVTVAGQAASIETEVQEYSGLQAGAPDASTVVSAPTTGNTDLSPATISMANPPSGDVAIGFLASHATNEPVTLSGFTQTPTTADGTSSIAAITAGYENPGPSSLTATYATAQWWTGGLAYWKAG